MKILKPLVKMSRLFLSARVNHPVSRRFFRPTLVLTACGLSLTLTQPAKAFKIYVNSISGPPVHENITREGLGFLSFDARESAVTGVWGVDFFTTIPGGVPDDAKYHFDDCEFSETITGNINPKYATMLNQAANGAAFAASGGGGNLWVVGAGSLDTSSIMFNFGWMLHAAQDFYSHSDWVELLTQGFIEERLFETGLSNWRVPAGNWVTHPIQNNLVIAEGNSTTLPAGWTPSFELGTWDTTPAGKTMLINANGTTKYGLVSGRYHGGDADSHSHETVHWNHSDATHGDTAEYGANFGMNKDEPSRLMYSMATECAVLQTAHEWRRLMALWRARFGESSAQAQERAVINYKTDVYVDNTLWPSGTQYDSYSLGVNFYEDRTYYQPGNGAASTPYHYVTIAEIGAEPGGAVMHIKPSQNFYVGSEHVGTAGHPLRLEVSPGSAGMVKLVK